MERNTNVWLDRKVDDWVSKGWISEEARQKIRKSYGRDEQRKSLLTTLPLYALLAVIGLAAAGIALIWGVSQFWYYVSITVRMGLACVLLLITQIGVGAAMFQERQGNLVAEGVALVHCLGIFAVLAMAEQSFYIGWDVTAYVAVCALLCLPVVYLLRSLAALVVYDLSLLYWTAAGGPMNTPGGTALLWVLLLLAVPFYNTLITMRDERRLSGFSWLMTMTVFAAFGLSARATDYIPFLLLGSLAVTIMLIGYSIDIHQSWGVPFRWFGRFAAAGSLLISCLPAAWDGIARVHEFHWVTALVTLVLFAVMIALMARTVKKRLWGPVLYLAVPFILAFETLLVRAGLYSSIPLVLSSLYMVVLGFFETSQGFKPGHSLHMKFGVVLFVSLILAFIFGTQFSPLAPLLAIVVLALILFQFKRTRKAKAWTALRAARRTGLRHSSTRVRGQVKEDREADVPPKDATPSWQVQDAASDADSLAEWMKDVRIPSPAELGLSAEPAGEEKADDLPKAPPVPAEPAEAPPAFTFTAPAADTEKSDVTPIAPVSQTVHETTEAVPQQMAVPQEPVPEEKPRITESPWSSMKPAPKRKKYFTHSPWSHQGGNRK
ncbi:DUF2157 domain-containing protein [Megasphaera elsdenii]|uniref:DUF2157 domain-containing protein n=1 Tax=Megasphaera elsdenii TaxID=907 RepID=UPI0014743AA7|nr:DUF2157 domain-containing protein [Megasphaera elsdenii]NME17652.1 DUF2157 domain-containing protein [Megasphaera elsdenii]